MTLKGKIPIKILLTMCLSLYLVCLSVMIPDTNAHLKDIQVTRGYNRIGDLKVWIADEGANTVVQLPESTELLRKVTILNKGEEVMFVRLMVHPVLKTRGDVQKIITLADLLPDFDPAVWVDGEDGYYYSLVPLEKKDEMGDTLAVFTKVKGTSTMTATDRLSIEIKAEAITARGNTYRKAWWNDKALGSGSVLKGIDDTLQGKTLP